MTRTQTFDVVTLTLSFQLVSGGEPLQSDWPIGENRKVGEWLDVHRLTERAFVVNEHRCWLANTLVVEMADGSIVLCDAPSHAAATRELIDWVDRQFRRSIDVAVNSHYHADASGGNDVLIQAGVRVISSEETARFTREESDGLKKTIVAAFADRPAVRSAFEATRMVPASETCPEGEGVELRFGDEVVRVIDPGPGHARDNVVTYFPSRRILFGGCMIKSGSNIGYTGDADLEHWPTAVRSLMALDVQYVIPGHGRTYSPDLLQHTIDLVERYRASSGEESDKN